MRFCKGVIKILLLQANISTNWVLIIVPVIWKFFLCLPIFRSLTSSYNKENFTNKMSVKKYFKYEKMFDYNCGIYS